MLNKKPRAEWMNWLRWATSLRCEVLAGDQITKKVPSLTSKSLFFRQTEEGAAGASCRI